MLEQEHSLSLDGFRRALASRHPVDEAGTERRDRAAVAVILRVSPDCRNDVQVLLIRRALRPGDPWSGHMAFPGGHVDAGEAMLDAAKRETAEEIGLDLQQHGRLLGQLDCLRPVTRASQMTVAPFVFELHAQPPPLVLNLHEVAEVIWTSLTPIHRGHARVTHAREVNGAQRHYEGYEVSGHVVWGMTWQMLRMLLQAHAQS